MRGHRRIFANAKRKQQQKIVQLQCQEQRIDHIPYYLSELSCAHFSDNLSRKSCKKTAQSYCFSIFCFFQTLETIDKMRERLNASRPQCPVGLTTLRFPGQFSEVTLAIRLLSIFIIDIFYDTKVYSSSLAIS